MDLSELESASKALEKSLDLWGWALFGAYLVAILAVPSAYQLYLGYPGTPVLRILGVIGVSVPFLFVAWKKTEGGWRWRRGEEED